MPPETSVLTDPESFFRERESDPSLLRPALVVAVAALVGAAAGFLQWQAMQDLYSSIEGPAGQIASVAGVFGIVGGLVGPFVAWILYAGVFHGISALFDGEGAFTDTLALVGWGFVPSILGGLVSLAITYYRFNVVGFTVPQTTDPQAMAEFSQEVSSGPLVTLDSGLGILFTLWSAFLWMFAVKYARDLDTRNAAITVAIPVAISLLLSLWGLVTSLGVL